MAKASRRLLPFLFLLYIVAYLDRINVSFAALHMNQDIGLSAAAYGLGAGLFFIGYFLFEVPSNLILARVGPRFWIARIMVTWGLVSMDMASVAGERGFYLLRFLLGLAEAGFFPGIILYLTYWFPAAERARIIALFMTATAVAGLIGSPVSGALLTLHGWLGLKGWQWLFLLEGLPAVLLGIVVWFTLPDRPQHASWLTAPEQDALQSLLNRETAPPHAPRTTVGALHSPTVWRFSLSYLSLVIGMYGIGMWLPQMLKSIAEVGDLAIGLLAAVPYLAAAAGMIWIGRHSDCRGERRVHGTLSLMAAAAGLAMAATVHSLPLALCFLSLAAIGIWGALGPFWAMATSYLAGPAAAAGIALINAIGNLGGFFGPYLMGWLKDLTIHYTAGLVTLAVIVAAGAWLLSLHPETLEAKP
ncbi:MAG: MFS transporter [Sulfuricellaceae bacterium]|jgi:ACS family tartrate transporter-like MFS transporter